MKRHITLGVLFLTALPAAAPAAVFELLGQVESATLAMEALIPPGSAIHGLVAFDDAAVAGGFAGDADLLSIDLNVGEFCFTTGVDTSQCPLGGVLLPVSIIDSVAVTFVDGRPTDTALAFTMFSPTIIVSIPMTVMDGVLSFDAGPLGTVTGSAPWVVPAPAALWLFGPALAGLAALRRHRSNRAETGQIIVGVPVNPPVNRR